VLVTKNNNDFKSRFLEVTAAYTEIYTCFLYFLQETIVSRGPPVRASWTPRGPRTTVWETLPYSNLVHHFHRAAMCIVQCLCIGLMPYRKFVTLRIALCSALLRRAKKWEW